MAKHSHHSNNVVPMKKKKVDAYKVAVLVLLVLNLLIQLVK